MTAFDLKTALEAVLIDGKPTVWALAAWAHEPPGDYGIVELSDGDDFEAENKHVERGTMCYAHYFTRIPTSEPRDEIEKALNGVSPCAWRLESAQYEDETQFLHYEWRVGLYG